MIPRSLLSWMIVITAGVNEHNHCLFLSKRGHVRSIFLRRIWPISIAISRPVDRCLEQEAKACIINCFCRMHHGKAASMAPFPQRMYRMSPLCRTVFERIVKANAQDGGIG